MIGANSETGKASGRTKAEISAALAVFSAPGEIHELRALNVGAAGCTMHGFYDYDHLGLMADHAAQLDADGATGVYFTPNPVSPAKAAGRLNPPRPLRAKTGDGATDADVTSRTRLLIDVDPVKADGHGDDSATDAEKEAAHKVLGECKALLEAEGFVGVVVGDSGNGGNLNPPIDLPNDDEAKKLVRAFLRGLAARCGGPGGKVDVTTFNASRIWKLPGTTARKGVATAERPHRRSRLISPFTRPTEEDARTNTAALRRLVAMWEQDRREKEEAARASGAKSAAAANGRPSCDGRCASLVKRACAYVATVEPAVSGQHGHDATYRVACKLVEFGLTRIEAEPLLTEYSERCKPPWSDKELKHKLEDAFGEASADPRYTEGGATGAPERNGRAAHASNGRAGGSEGAAGDGWGRPNRRRDHTRLLPGYL